FIYLEDVLYYVYCQPKCPPHMYGCPTVVGWWDKSGSSADSQPVKNAYEFFALVRSIWDRSGSCHMFKSRLAKLLTSAPLCTTAIPVTKVVGFGLGDFSTTASEKWLKENMDYMEEIEQDLDYPERTPELEVKGLCTHHAMALTMASVVETIQKKQHGAQRGRHIKLLTQEPAYTPAMETMLKEIGNFDIVGKYGASGFAELDDNCIVFAPFVNAPVKQIMADLSRPAIIICNQI
ncbi:uncharacterized protein B0I36DRAFT_211714, partial [Microdochium trichocladiopsis]